MRIVYSPGGQLCNKLWGYVHFVAYSFKENEKIVFLIFGEYMHLFPNLRKYKNICFIKNHRKCVRLIHGACLLMKKRTNRVIDGWQYRYKTEWLEDFFDKIHFLFSPHPFVIQKCERIISELKNNGQIVVGIHIRRGDYAQYRHGIYYFDDATYIRYMKQIEKQIGQKVSFFISSTDKISFHDPDISYFQIPQSTNIEDLYSLSLCDYILGPPSSFSMWASFYGKTPLRVVSYKDESISLDEFKIIAAFDTFQDGSVLPSPSFNPSTCK
jgi:hypothetical protein